MWPKRFDKHKDEQLLESIELIFVYMLQYTLSGQTLSQIRIYTSLPKIKRIILLKMYF